jgi:hypothetical protein
MKTMILLPLLYSMTAFSALPQFYEGQILKGELYKPGTKPTGQSCQVEILQVIKREDRGIHCLDLKVKASWYKEAIIINNDISTVRGDLRSCVEASSWEASEQDTIFDPENYKDNIVYSYDSTTSKYRSYMFIESDGKIESMTLDKAVGLFRSKNRWCKF